MKKIFSLLCFICLSLSSWAQDAVLGIKFGENYNSVKSSLEARYGKYNVHEEKGNLKVYDISVGDYAFNCGLFDFQYHGVNSYFYYAEFQKNYGVNESEQAKSYREMLRGTLERKYYCFEWTNKQGYKCYDFKETSEVNSSSICSLLVNKSKSKGGGMFIYVTLSYGPYHFVDETEDF